MTRSTWLAALFSMTLAGSAFAQTGAANRALPPPDPAQNGVPQGAQGGTAQGSDATTGKGSTGGTESSFGGGQQTKKGPADTTDRSATQGSDRMGSTFAANQLVGQIKNIDRDQKQVTIEQQGQPQNLQLTDNATVFVEGRLGSWQDLKEGQQVRAAYEERGGQKTLRWIEVAPQQRAPQQGQQKQQQKPGGIREGTQQGGAAPEGGPLDDAGGGGDVANGASTPTNRGGEQMGGAPLGEGAGTRNLPNTQGASGQGTVGGSDASDSSGGTVGSTPRGSGELPKSSQQGAVDKKSTTGANQQQQGQQQSGTGGSFGGGASSGAQGGGSSAQGGAKGGSAGQNAAQNEVMGTVVALDQDANKVTVSSADKEWTLTLRDPSAVYKDGKKASFDQLKEGQQVRASLDQSKQSATRIDIVSGGDTETGLQKDRNKRLDDDQMRKGTTESPY